MKTLCLIVVSSFLIAITSCHPKQTDSAVSKTDSLAKKLTHEVKADGLNIYYYDNGIKKMEGIFKNEKREGLWRAWYINGTLWSEAHYTNGKNNGKSTVYFENGKIRYEGNYLDGKKTGLWKYYDEQGNAVKEIVK